MTQATQWTEDLTARVLLLNKTKSLPDIARLVGVNRETLRRKINALGVPLFVAKTKATTHDRPVRIPKDQILMRGVWFEDHPDGDKDRFKGRRPLPCAPRSNVGCAADMCANGGFL